MLISLCAQVLDCFNIKTSTSAIKTTFHGADLNKLLEQCCVVHLTNRHPLSKLTRSLLGVPERHLLEHHPLPPALRVHRVHSDLEGHVRLQVVQVEVGLGRGDVVPRRRRALGVQLEEEVLGQAAVEARQTGDLRRAARLVGQRAAAHRERFA